jgi:CBS-domain-containing membrane protein
MDCTQNGPFSSLNRTYRGISGVGIRCACQSSGAAPCGLGGNLVSAIVGVLLSRTGLSPFAMDVMAVGLAIMMMHLLRCLHPPGGLWPYL